MNLRRSVRSVPNVNANSVRLHYLRRMRALVKLVMANIYWLSDTEEKISDNWMKNVQLMTRKKKKKSGLSMQDKAILSKPKEDRTEQDKYVLNLKLGVLKCFKRYPEEVKCRLADVTYYVYYGPGRVLLKQDQMPTALYFLLSGEVKISLRHYNKQLKEWIEEEAGTMSSGSVFGELALLHGVEREATITTTEPCELLKISKEDFDVILKSTVRKAWHEISREIEEFSFFKEWDFVTKRECAIMARTRKYLPGETMLGGEVRLKEHVFFLVSGECYIMERLQVMVRVVNGLKKYSLPSDVVNPKVEAAPSLHEILSKYEGSETDLRGTNVDVLNSLVSYEAFPERDWEIEERFMKVCTLTKGACFNIGEHFLRRQVIADTAVKVLLVPRYWLMRNNRGNIWNRVQAFMNSHIPDTKQIFKHYLEAMKFNRYRKQLVKDILAECRISTTTTIHDVPYSIRMRAGMDSGY